ncbi:type VI secretion system baseplate subunit TssF [Photorhabdus bodei]|uniref:Type VI secretion system baseplate subunit TssF n=1 Tax=Photorhabdus bodei TaxID=2029681 RepID=A0AAW6BJC7_9GAMM|nr:type VI secretion system baseplate subunit TssF [Photorhabdus bodei]MDB6373724.1 type VI secretion system baseplate subunit TssF [Photorhabdus bodei]
MNKKESLFLQELQYIRQLAQEAAKENPHLADFLSEGAGDPDIERVMQGFALSASRIREKIEDEFPELTSGMLAHIWPYAICHVPGPAHKHRSIFTQRETSSGRDNATRRSAGFCR